MKKIEEAEHRLTKIHSEMKESARESKKMEAMGKLI